MKSANEIKMKNSKEEKCVNKGKVKNMGAKIKFGFASTVRSWRIVYLGWVEFRVGGFGGDESKFLEWLKFGWLSGQYFWRRS